MNPFIIIRVMHAIINTNRTSSAMAEIMQHIHLITLCGFASARISPIFVYFMRRRRVNSTARPIESIYTATVFLYEKPPISPMVQQTVAIAKVIRTMSMITTSFRIVFFDFSFSIRLKFCFRFGL